MDMQTRNQETKAEGKWSGLKNLAEGLLTKHFQSRALTDQIIWAKSFYDSPDADFKRGDLSMYEHGVFWDDNRFSMSMGRVGFYERQEKLMENADYKQLWKRYAERQFTYARWQDEKGALSRFCEKLFDNDSHLTAIAAYTAAMITASVIDMPKMAINFVDRQRIRHAHNKLEDQLEKQLQDQPQTQDTKQDSKVVPLKFK